MTKQEKKESDAARYQKNKEKLQQQTRDWIKRNPEKRSDMIRRYKYGTDGKELFEIQKGLCAICSTSLHQKPRNQRHLDHCHETGKVRGWLCVNCNLGIGRFPTIALLMRALKYIGE